MADGLQPGGVNDLGGWAGFGIPDALGFGGAGAGDGNMADWLNRMLKIKEDQNRVAAMHAQPKPFFAGPVAPTHPWMGLMAKGILGFEDNIQKRMQEMNEINQGNQQAAIARKFAFAPVAQEMVRQSGLTNRANAFSNMFAGDQANQLSGYTSNIGQGIDFRKARDRMSKMMRTA